MAMRVGAPARAVACLRQRDALADDDRRRFDRDFSVVLRRALRAVDEH